MTPLQVAVAGIGAWTPQWPGWPALRHALQDAAAQQSDAVGGEAAGGGASRPVPLLLPPAERRRVPDGVAVALEVAREAIGAAAASGWPVGPVDPTSKLQETGSDAADTDAPAEPTAALASVFASAHGELAIVDYLCRTLADDPLLLSPTRFHHSVHNAAAGYWSIATPSTGPSTSIAAGDASFALGLLEAATQVVVESRPVLLVVFDTPTVGLLAQAAPNTALFGAALLLAPIETAVDAPRLAIAFEDRASTATPLGAALQPLAASCPAARAIPLLAALARGGAAVVDYPASDPPDRSATVSVSVLGPRQQRTTAGHAALT